MFPPSTTSQYAANRGNKRDPSASPSCRAAFAHRTPPRLVYNSAYSSSPARSPSPLKRRVWPTESMDEDDVFSSPKPSTNLVMTRGNPLGEPTPRANSSSNDDDNLFMAPASAFQSCTFAPPSSSPLPQRTPIKQIPRVLATPERPTFSVNPINLFSAATAGTKRKPTNSFSTPERRLVLTPLNTVSSGEGTAKGEPGTFAFDKLAPLPAPRFGARTPQSKAETEMQFKRQADSMTQLHLQDHDESGDESGYDSGIELKSGDETSQRLFFAAGGGTTAISSKMKKAPALEVLIKKALIEEEATEVSPGGHITKRRARSRPVSSELFEKAHTTPAPIKTKMIPTPLLSTKKSSGNVAFPSGARNRRTSASSTTSTSSIELGSPRPRTRRSSGASRTRAQSTNQRQPLNRLTSTSSATLFFGPAIPQPEPRTKKLSNASITSSISSHSSRMEVDPPAKPVARPPARSRHSFGGTTKAVWSWEESSSSSTKFPRIEDDEADLFFSAPAHVSDFPFNAAGNSPSPVRKKSKTFVEQLPKKFRPRDSGIVLDSDDEGLGLSTHSHKLPTVPSLNSLSSSSSGDTLVTPCGEPGVASAWPGVGIAGYDSDMLGSELEDSARMDAFILRTLLGGTRPSANVPGEGKRAPGTPVKKVKTAHLVQRPWQSAVANKIGFPGFDPPRENREKGGRVKPRKSLPAAFPGVLEGGRQTRQRRDAMMAGGTAAAETEDDDEASPSMRRDGLYDGLGLGKPPVDPKERTRWLMRRSSSGAFSSGSETCGSVNATPTRKDWNTTTPIQHSPLTNLLQLPEARFSGGSSVSPSSIASISPTLAATTKAVHPPSAFQHRRGLSQTHNLVDFGVTNPSPKKGALKINTSITQRPPHPRANQFPGSTVRGRLPAPTGEERPGRFDQDFVEIDELGHGEFGRVIKARHKEDPGEVFAVKKSKRFEGVKHRLRLREEVDVLKHLHEVAVAQGYGTSHCNVLGYMDSWEEDETLFIQTELCALGNFGHFLWEYGRAFPKLDEARVWKIFAELSEGLHFIHNAGVIHLDLKPANIFVTDQGRFKIGDFGMASIWPRPALKVAGEKTSFEREGDKLYLAPEVLQGKYSKAADIFSLGITMLETATNIVIPDQGDAWHRLRHEDFSQLNFTGVSTELIELLKSMMRSEPTLRVDAQLVCNHPVVARARHAMDIARSELGPVFAASAMAGAPNGWLDDILGRQQEWDGDEGDEAMDLGL